VPEAPMLEKYRFLTKITAQHQLVQITYTIKMKEANPIKWICPE